MDMLVRSVTVTLMLGCAASVLAQAGSPPPAQSAGRSESPKPPATAAAKALRFPIQMTEASLLVAVSRGVETFAEQLRDVLPDLPVAVSSGTAKAHGTVLDGYGVIFYVEVPTIRWAVIDTFLDLVGPVRSAQGANRPASAVVSSPAQSASTAGADQRLATAAQNSRQVYDKLMKDSIIDALLDSVVLPLQPADTLAIWVRAEDPSEPHTAIVSIKAADLEAFRLKKLSREEARKRIEIKEF